MDKLLTIKSDDIEEFSLQGTVTKGKVVEMYDGDTCKIVLIYKNELMKFNCRLMHLDTPEMKPPRNKPNREEEIKNAIKCRNRLLQLTSSCELSLEDNKTKIQIKKLLDKNNKIITIKCHEFDKYGRLLVELLNEENDIKTFNDILIEEGMAKRYEGGTKDIFTY